MIDHLLGRPSVAYKRTQVLLVLLFWTVTLLTGNKNGPPLVRWFSKKFRARLTPWQVLAGTLTCLYAIKNADSLLGLSAPEPLARLYSRDFYRATWIVTALDTGFATAMHVRPKWLRDILSMLFSGYYLFFANEADEKLRKFRAFCTVEMLRATWEKTGSPLVRAATYRSRPKIQLKKKIVLPRPQGSPYSKPVIAWLYYDGSEDELAFCRELILDFPGGGFVCMGPMHHEERIHRWTIRTGRPVLAIEYSKAPEYPYPYALHECFDVYRLLYETKGAAIGMQQGEIRTVMTGDSAGANLAAAVMIKILEMPPASRLPLPLSLIWTYPALDFNFTSFMPPEHLRILRHESSATLKGIAEQKDHLKHASPLAVVDDAPPRHRRRKSWSKSFSKLPSTLMNTLKSPIPTPALPLPGGVTKRLPLPPQFTGSDKMVKDTVDSPMTAAPDDNHVDEGAEADNDGEGDESRDEREQSISERVQYWNPDRGYAELNADLTSPLTGKKIQASNTTLGTRLTMTSRTGFFNDRIISPSMMRAMAICYVGPRNSPDLSKNYYISPILTPASLLAQFPPVYLLCGERDPFSDDTLIFSGRLRDAKYARKAEVLAKQARHGEGLRMSSATQARKDPILDESEDDWVTTRFIEGWSHGFMQMVTLLPKVEHFFALTADWASFSFDRYESQMQATPTPAAPARLASPGMVLPRPQASSANHTGPGQESTSEKEEEEPLSFVPRRRGSRTASPSPADNIRAQLLAAASSSSGEGGVEKALHRSPLSSENTSDTNTGSTSTAPTSLASMQRRGSAGIKATSPPLSSSPPSSRRTSPSEGTAKTVGGSGDPIRRVLRDEADLLQLPASGSPGKITPTSSRSAHHHPPHTAPSSAVGSGTATPSLRKGSDAVENAVAASAFVEASDIIKRRREDAVYNLGSALITSDQEGSSSSEGGNDPTAQSP